MPGRASESYMSAHIDASISFLMMIVWAALHATFCFGAASSTQNRAAVVVRFAEVPLPGNVPWHMQQSLGVAGSWQPNRQGMIGWRCSCSADSNGCSLWMRQECLTVG